MAITMTLQEARGIVQGVRPAPRRQDQGDEPVLPPPGTSGPGTSPSGPTGGGGLEGPTFEQSSGERYGADLERAYNNIQSGNYGIEDVRALQDAGLITATQAGKLLEGGGGAGDPYAANREGRAAAGFASDEEQRRINNAFAWQDLLNSQKYADRNFGLEQMQANRGELGQRASAGLSTGNLLLDMALRSDDLANNPGNFPAYLSSLQGNQAAGPSLQSLVGEGLTITPDENNYLNDPRFKSVISSLLNYGTVPDPGAVDLVQQQFNENPNALSGFANFARYDEENKPVPMSHGGDVLSGLGGPKFRNSITNYQRPDPLTYKSPNVPSVGATYGESGVPMVGNAGPVTINDFASQTPLAVAGEAGPETVSVSPAQGTARALAKALSTNAYGSAIPRDILARLGEGFLPNPGDLPDWLLAKLPPSLRQMFAALATAQLGSTGAADYDWTRGLYEQRGFTGAGGIVR